MAITAIDYIAWRALAKNGALPKEPDILEIGEANWYWQDGVGVELAEVISDIREMLPDAETHVRAMIAAANDTFAMAKAFYRTFLNCRDIVAIDLNGTAAARKCDLNEPLPFDRQFHIVINTGTIEHVFNQHQAFKTIHDHTLPNGVMFHSFPFTGWLDHGFYSYNPTFISDLAAANGYAILLWLYGVLSPLKVVQVQSIEHIHRMAKDGQIGGNSAFYVAFRKPLEEKPFAVPAQGYYAGRVSEKEKADWEALR